MRVVVIGLGATGLPTALALAERGHAVVGIDRHGVSAPAGSSTGETRIFRFAHDRTSDVRLSRRALERWDALADGGPPLVDRVGLLLRGERSEAWAEALAEEGVAHEHLDADGVARVFPEAAARPGEPAVLVPGDGVVFARRGLAAMADAARAHGAELSAPERMEAIEETPAGVRVTTDQRVLEADVAVLAVGPWSVEVLPWLGVRLPLAPALGQVTYWRGGGAWERRPTLIDFAEGRLGVYGLPTPGKGYKVGLDYGCEASWDPAADSWPPSAHEEELNGAWVDAHLPGLVADGPHLTERCPWTMTTDSDFAYGRRGSIVIAAGCCGHGFKHSPVLGEILADLAEDRPLDPDAAPFALDRLSPDAAFAYVETPLGPRVSI